MLQERLRKDLIEWLKWLQQHVGFTGWRFDFVKGYAGDAVKVCILGSSRRHGLPCKLKQPAVSRSADERSHPSIGAC